MNLQSAQEKLSRKLTNVSKVAEGVLRGVWRRNERDVAAYVFDLNNRLPDTVGELSGYLDEVMGPAYFDKDASPDLRWNNYLYFVVDKGIAGNAAFQATKRNLEADRSYARKFVVVEDDFDRVLDELHSVAAVDDSLAARDVVRAWSDRLSAIGLEDVLDGERPIADVVRSISSGTAKGSVRAKKETGVEASQRLVESHIASIQLSGFRPYPRRKSFERLGKANLLFGSNGVGKTSLLEGLEFLFCGANRRSNASAGAAVAATLVSGHIVRTSGEQVLSDFKTRQRLWYGSDDNSRQNKLPNQFARFNFLNTDAAAELSLLKEDPNGGNAESLAALLSGHEATLMWRRIQDVRNAVADEARSKRSDRKLAETEHKAKEEVRVDLEAAPGQSDAAFSVFIKDLARIGWRDVPDSKQAVTEALVAILSELTSRLHVIQQIDWLVEPVTFSVIGEQASKLQIACEDVRGRLSAIDDYERLRSVFAQRQSLTESRLTALAAISPTAFAELKELSSELERSNDELARDASLFAALPMDPIPEDWEFIPGTESLLEAHAESNNRLLGVSEQLEASKRELASMATIQSQLQRAITELHDWAQKVVEHRHSDSNCPVCGTEFASGELLQRMRALSLVTSDARISELRRRVEHLTSERFRSANEASWFGQLCKFTGLLFGGNASMSVSDAHYAVSNTIDRRRRLLETKQRAQQGLDAYARVGVSLDMIHRLCLPVEGDDGPRPASLDISAASERAKDYLEHLQRIIRELDERIVQRNAEIKFRLGSAGVHIAGPMASRIEELMTRQRVAQQASDGCAMTHRYLELAPATELSSLLTSLEASVLGAQRVLAASDADSSSATRLTTVREKLVQLSERIGRIGTSIDRLVSAQRVLDDIIENQSLDSANAAVVDATHEVADSIFGRIHAPAEYFITADAEMPLRRRDNNSSVQLNQVSTGQRAAYALSMFLAMNAQVKAGPKVILLDDPISHIDDLNALSFLDYLRNLVLRSDRQVFFATADEKVAGLFVHKFRFLGEEFRTFELGRG